MSNTLHIQLEVRLGKSFELKAEKLVFQPGLNILLGANGSGKSTFLKALGKYIPSENYDCSWDSKELDKLSHSERSHVFSYSGTDILGNIPVRNLMEIYQCQKLDSYFELPQNWMEKSLFELSDGEKQKVQHSLCLQNKKPLVLLDEPTAHLDPVQKNVFWENLKKYASEHEKVVIAATHDYLELKKLPLSFFLLINGRIKGPFSHTELPIATEIYPF